jgi:hypothetical protein
MCGDLPVTVTHARDRQSEREAGPAVEIADRLAEAIARLSLSLARLERRVNDQGLRPRSRA